jgi:CHAT domain
MPQAQQPDALAAVTGRTSLVIGLAAAAERLPWLFARCWLFLGRFEAQSRNAADLDLALADFDALPAEYPARPKLAALLVEAQLKVGGLPEPDRVARMESLCAIAGGDPEPLPQWPQVHAEMIDLARLTAPGAEQAGDTPPALGSAVEHIPRTTGSVSPCDPSRVRCLLTDGSTYLRRFEETGARSDLASGISLLEQARELAGSSVHPLWTAASAPLARGYRLSGHGSLGREVALSGLRGHAWNVLLQPSAATMRVTARVAAEEALEVARMCLTDGDPERAATALDAGRGLILFAANENRDVATRLTVLSETRLAAQWRRATEFAPPHEVPEELRRQVVCALAGIPLDVDDPVSASPSDSRVRLLDPPDLYEIRAALGVLGVDALVYLVPGDRADGAAIIVPAEDALSWTLLPELRPAALTEFDRYLVAGADGMPQDAPSRKEILRSAGTSADRSRRTVSARSGPILDRVCDWAWRAAIGPLLARFGKRPANRPVRLALIPMCELAGVPWHAARYRADGRVHYALERAIFSYAVSARMLCESAWRGDVPLSGAGLVVADPDTGGSAGPLPAARAEAQAIRDSFYPAARYLGRRADGGPSGEGAGDRAQVLAWLADPDGGQTAHIACHSQAQTETDPDDASCLLLSGGERLSTRELAGVLADNPGREIGLAVLAVSGGAGSGRGRDDALSPGTALLANNVRSVISTLWSVPDALTTALMFMFHHYLREQAMSPRDALREAQLWMIGDGPPPESMPERLRAGLAGRGRLGVAAWAGFVHAGR